jgi:glycerol kinase
VREPGTVKATYGTGSSLMTLTSGRIMSRSGLSSTIAWSTSAGVAYALEGNISVSGQAVAFMGSLLGITDPAAVAALAATVPDSNGVTFVPALVGLGAPYWDPDARGSVSGLSLGTTPAHLARAAVEAIAFQVADVFTAMQTDLGQPLTGLSADGGAARNDMLMQFQADLIDRPVLRGELPEVSAAGAALLAASGLGRNTTRGNKAQRQFIPQMSEANRNAALSGWLAGVGRVLQRDPVT